MPTRIKAAQFQAKHGKPRKAKPITRLDLSNEHSEQRDYFKWINWMLPHHPHWESIYAIPNAGKRSYGALQYYLDEGMRPGMVDICHPFARGGYNALYIEMKWGKKTQKKNQPRDNQVHRMKLLRANNNKVEVCYGFEEAKSVLLEYENL